MRKLLVLNGSPKKRKSQSEKFTSDFLKNFNEEQYDIDKIFLYELNYSKYLYEQIMAADILVLATPLYVDCFPAKVLELLEGVESYCRESFFERRPQCYLIINCGFMEYTQNHTAIEIMKRFCEAVEFQFVQAVAIGSGAMILDSKQREDVSRCLYLLSRTIEGKQMASEVMGLNVKMPKFLFMSKSNRIWIEAGKKRGLTKKDLKARYY